MTTSIIKILTDWIVFKYESTNSYVVQWFNIRVKLELNLIAFRDMSGWKS